MLSIFKNGIGPFGIFNKKILQSCVFFSCLILLSHSSLAYTVTTFSPDSYPFTNSELGIQGLTIEDFEDSTLANGLNISFGPYQGNGIKDFSASDLTQSPSSAWDGNQLLSHDSNYSVFFHFDNPVEAFGIGFSNASPNLDISLNQGDYGFSNIGNFAEFESGSSQNLYFFITADEGDNLIQTMRFDVGTWGWTSDYDHVAFGTPGQAVVAPSSILLLGLGVIGILGYRRKS